MVGFNRHYVRLVRTEITPDPVKMMALGSFGSAIVRCEKGEME